MFSKLHKKILYGICALAVLCSPAIAETNMVLNKPFVNMDKVLIVITLLSLMFGTVYWIKFRKILHFTRKNHNSRRWKSYIANYFSTAFVAWSSKNPTKKINKKFMHIFNVNEFVDIDDIFPADALRKLNQLQEQLEQSEKGFEASLNLEDGRIFLLLGTFIAASQVQPKSYLIEFIDISDYKNELDRLKKVEINFNKLNAIVNTFPIPIWHRLEDFNLSLCNQAYIDAVEKDELEQVLSEQTELALHQLPLQGKGLAKKASLTSRLARENCHIVINGKRRLMEINEFPLGDDKGFGGYAIDITDIEEAKKEKNLHIQANSEILENMTTAVAIYGPNKQLMFFNNAYATLWKLDKKWLHSKPYIDEVVEAQREIRRLPEMVDFPAYKKSLQRLFTTLIENYEDILVLPDGTTLRRHISPHPFGGLFFMFEDVTDKVTLEQSYNTLIEVERETLNNLHEGIAVFGSDGRLKLYNPNYKNIWNLSDSYLEDEPHINDILDITRSQFDSIKKRDKFFNKIFEALSERTRSHGKIELKKNQFFEYMTSPLPNGNIMLSFVNVTDGIRAELALIERNEALMTADRLKTEFLAHISYELRTPLNTILGFSEVIKNQYFGSINEKQDEYLDGIILSSQKLSSLIDDILDIALVEAGQIHLEKKGVYVDALFSNVIGLVREAAKKHDIVICTNFPKSKLLIQVDERRMKQVLYNLLSNAIKFTPSGGEVTVSAKDIDGFVCLSVKDNGVGIDVEDREKIFDKFHQGQNKKGGLGLGLSLVKSIIEFHGGYVNIESETNTGTTVSCILPKPEFDQDFIEDQKTPKIA